MLSVVNNYYELRLIHIMKYKYIIPIKLVSINLYLYLFIRIRILKNRVYKKPAIFKRGIWIYRALEF